MPEFRTLAEQGLDRFFGDAGSDWRHVLDGERLEIDLIYGGHEPTIEAIHFMDGTRQVAPLGAFDSRRCAWALKEALKKGGAT